MSAAPKLVPLSRIAAHLETITGKRPHVSTILRWILRGVGGRKLPGVRQGGQWLAALEDAESFVIPASSAPPVLASHQAEVERLALAAMLGRAPSVGAR